MADYFASIFGTEKDKNLYVNPKNSAKSQGKEITDEEDQKHFDEFFEDIYVELEEKYGPIEEMNVCDNLGDHLIGNVYVRFKSEEDAERAVEDLNDRWFGGKPVYAELSTVTDFREAGCRQYEIGTCTRGGFCNFMHLKQISSNLKRHLFGTSKSRRSTRRSHRSHISRSRSPSWSRSRSRSRSSSVSRDRAHRHDRKPSTVKAHRHQRSPTKSVSPISPRPSRSRSRTSRSSPLLPPPDSRRSRSRSRSYSPHSKSSVSRSRHRRSRKSSSKRRR